MEAEARYTYVGAAVLALVAALVAAVMWLQGIGGRDEFNRYAIYFENQALDGLQVGGEVNLRGIKVGRVEDYALSDTKLNRVRVEVRVDRRAPVHTNTVAVVSRNFVTGIASITLVNREPLGAVLTQASTDDPLPVIGEGQSNLDEITGRVNQVSEQATSALTNINQMLSADNRRDVMETVRSLRDLASGLNKRLAALDRALDRTASAATSIGSAAGRLGQSGDRVATVAEKAGRHLDTTLARAELTLDEARTALGRAATTFEALERQAGTTGRRLENTALQIDDQLSAATAELRLSMEATSRILDRLRDPRAALFGPGQAQLGPGESQP
jgi:phospholipid/cholesterol/gamma-HCH transport system substrate-binding protein